MSKATPRPWTLSQTGNSVYIDKRRIPTIEIDSPADACWVAQVQIHRSCTTTPEGDANARLIASAPEMLEALKRVAYEDDRKAGFDYLVQRTIMDQVKSVIARAEGRS